MTSNGKDAFHRVPLLAATHFRDAVERVLTIFLLPFPRTKCQKPGMTQGDDGYPEIGRKTPAARQIRELRDHGEVSSSTPFEACHPFAPGSRTRRLHLMYYDMWPTRLLRATAGLHRCSKSDTLALKTTEMASSKVKTVGRRQ